MDWAVIWCTVAIRKKLVGLSLRVIGSLAWLGQALVEWQEGDPLRACGGLD